MDHGVIGIFYCSQMSWFFFLLYHWPGIKAPWKSVLGFLFCSFKHIHKSSNMCASYVCSSAVHIHTEVVNFHLIYYSFLSREHFNDNYEYERSQQQWKPKNWWVILDSGWPIQQQNKSSELQFLYHISFSSHVLHVHVHTLSHHFHFGIYFWWPCKCLLFIH